MDRARCRWVQAENRMSLDDSEMRRHFDFVVVGGGTAGCVLAARLSEDGRHSVCLVEAGGTARSLFSSIPGAIVLAQRSPSLNWGFKTAPQTHLNGRQIPVPRGRGLGGSALINGMVYFRGHPTDFDAWAAAGATGWSYGEVLPYFCRSERNENFAESVLHGRQGPMSVRTVRHPNPLNHAFLEALARQGVPASEDLNGWDSEGAALRQVAIRGGTRVTSATAFLRPALSRRNLTVLCDARATRLLFEARRAVGVEVRLAHGAVRRLHANREVILAAGAIQSPQLLLLSGVGDQRQLSDMGIAVRHHLPAVGRNLHDHLACPVYMEMKDSSSYGISWRSMPRNLLNIAQYLLFRNGPLADNIFESAAFMRSSPALARPDLQLVFQPAKRPPPWFPFPMGHGFASSPVGLYPRSRGQLSLASPDPLAPPTIDPNLLSDPEDLVPLLRGIRLIRKLFADPAFARFRARESLPGVAAQDDAALSEYVRAHSYTVHHPVSTCRMGSDDAAVVDPSLRVKGIGGLRIADASVFPSIIGGNTNAAVVMVAEKAADLVLGRAPPSAADVPSRAVPQASAPQEIQTG